MNSKLLLIEYQEISDYLINEIQFSDINEIKSFRLPGTRIIVTFSAEFSQRKLDFEKLQKILPEHFCVF